jgi:hemoglobin-like flavoprotein
VWTAPAARLKEAGTDAPRCAVLAQFGDRVVSDAHVNAAQIELVRSTWARVRPVQTAAAELFYGKLFELEPQLQPLFKGDFAAQGQKLMRMLDAAVRGLEHPQALAPAFKDLGRRHLRYGAAPVDYGTVAIALLWTLEQILGQAFTPDVRLAWTEAYTLISRLMQG